MRTVLENYALEDDKFGGWGGGGLSAALSLDCMIRRLNIFISVRINMSNIQIK